MLAQATMPNWESQRPWHLREEDLQWTPPVQPSPRGISPPPRCRPHKSHHATPTDRVGGGMGRGNRPPAPHYFPRRPSSGSAALRSSPTPDGGHGAATSTWTRHSLRLALPGRHHKHLRYHTRPNHRTSTLMTCHCGRNGSTPTWPYQVALGGWTFFVWGDGLWDTPFPPEDACIPLRWVSLALGKVLPPTKAIRLHGRETPAHDSPCTSGSPLPHLPVGSTPLLCLLRYGREGWPADLHRHSRTAWAALRSTSLPTALLLHNHQDWPREPLVLQRHGEQHRSARKEKIGRTNGRVNGPAARHHHRPSTSGIRHARGCDSSPKRQQLRSPPRHPFEGCYPATTRQSPRGPPPPHKHRASCACGQPTRRLRDPRGVGTPWRGGPNRGGEGG